MSIVSSRRIAQLAGLTLLCIAIAGCAGPVEREDEELTDPELLQRMRTIDPLAGVDEQRRGETAPTLVEFWVDEQGRPRVSVLPYVIIDPGEVDPELEDVGEEPFDTPYPPDQSQQDR